MESPPPPLPPPCYISQGSKKRVFPGGSSTCMEADVVEIPPPGNSSSKLKSLKLKEKEVIFPEVIDVDMDDDYEDIMLLDREVDTKRKGKDVFSKLPSGSSSGINDGSGNGVQSPEKNYVSGSHYLINGEDFDADFFYGENEYVDMSQDDPLYDDQYAIIQAHLDSWDIPPGVEVSVPWFTGHEENKLKPAVASTSNHSSSPIDVDGVVFPPNSNSSSSIWPMEFEQSSDKSIIGENLISGDKVKGSGQPKKWEPSSSWLLKDPAHDYLTSSSSMDMHDSRHHLAESWRHHLAESWRSKTKRNRQLGYNMLEGGSHNQFSHHISSFTKHPVSGPLTGLASRFVDQSGPLPVFPDDMAFGPWDMDPIVGQKSATASGNSSGLLSGKAKYGDPGEFLKNFDLFKKFDTVQDFTDHYYSKNGFSVRQPSKNWAKKIQEEWRILENDLPDTIFVRVYESRMDILRAVIIGAEGTPYHDGLFFFDVFFPSNYPNVPPHVHYHSGGLRINPNLYNCGKVCLSLLNTWSGSHKEKWIPGVSTILQVLVSIQGLILNAKPYFNEPGYASMSGTPGGESNSLQYNESTFILSLKTMAYNIRRPPKYFEDLIAGHFYKHARDILVACKAYMDGAQVGCLVKGGVQDVDEGDKSCSQHFKNSLAGYIKTLVDAFAEIGVKDCDEFLALAQKTNRMVPSQPVAQNFYYY
ncbi:unnamed protein product [Coffea canephora]|uniref:E2 ubiquitin-conjugating enzyme n=1 Tax=Coffea canephora TaxID=49390 RepID=A0A068UBP9_COFCA|nr:unnamed protein product [Coffea canephora]